MRTLLLSDIHANDIALEAVLADAAGAWDQLWFLGDLVGYGPQPNEAVARLRDQSPAVALSGNHDWAVLGKLDPSEFNAEARMVVRWTDRQLSAENRLYLDALPPYHLAPSFTLAHASPRHPVWEYILDPDTALENFDQFNTPCCLVGHSHLPLVFILDEAAGELRYRVAGPGDVVDLRDGRLIVNPGSVGQPRDNDPRAAYALIDHEVMTLTFHRVAYDVAATQALMRQHKMPRRLIKRLEHGL